MPIYNERLHAYEIVYSKVEAICGSTRLPYIRIAHLYLTIYLFTFNKSRDFIYRSGGRFTECEFHKRISKLLFLCPRWVFLNFFIQSMPLATFSTCNSKIMRSVIICAHPLMWVANRMGLFWSGRGVVE